MKGTYLVHKQLKIRSEEQTITDDGLDFFVFCLVLPRVYLCIFAYWCCPVTVYFLLILCFHYHTRW